MTRLLAVALFLSLLIVPVAGQERESFRDRLVRRIDARLAEEMKRVRAALIEEIDRALAEEGIGGAADAEAPMPEGFDELLDDVGKAKRDARKTGGSKQPAEPIGEKPDWLGAEVTAAPPVLTAQLGLPKNAPVVTRVPDGSAAAKIGVRPGDIYVSISRVDDRVSKVVVFRDGKRITLGGGE
jgi:hypothetical protein